MTAPGRLRGASNTANGPMALRSMSWDEYQALNKRGVTDERMLEEGFTIPKAPVLQKMSWDEYNQLRDNGLSEVQIRLQGYEIPKDPRGFWAKGRDLVLRPGVQGAALGSSEEIRGAGATAGVGSTMAGRMYTQRKNPIGDLPYIQVRDKERAELARARLDAPKTAMASEFIGSLLAPGASFGKVAKGVGYGAKTLKGAAIGGGSGLLHGIGTSEGVGLGEMLAQGAREGILGLGLGGTVGSVPYVVRGLTGATTQANKLMKARQNLLQSLERVGENPDDVYARGADQVRAARVAEKAREAARVAKEAREAARVANEPDPGPPPDPNLPPDGGRGEGGGLVLDALGVPGGANVLGRLGPLNPDIAKKLSTEARLYPKRPLAQAIQRASQKEKGGIERPVIPSEIGILASIFGAGVRRARRNEAATLVNHLLQPLDDAALQAILPRKGLSLNTANALNTGVQSGSRLLQAEREVEALLMGEKVTRSKNLAEAQRRADLKAELKATNAANVETARVAKLDKQEAARVAKLAEQEAALEGSAMDYNKKLDVKAAEAADRAAKQEAALIGGAMDHNKVIDTRAANAATRAAKQEAALIGGAMDHNKVIDTRAANAATRAADVETARVAKLAEQEAALIGNAMDHNKVIDVKAANAATRAAEKMEVIQGKALTENLPPGARLNTTKFVTTNEPKPTSEEGSLVPSLRFGERPGGPVPYFPDPPPDGGGGAAVVPLPRPVVPSSPSVVTPSETLTQAQAAANQQARQQAARPRFDPETGEVLPEIPVPRGNVGANKMPIPLLTPSETLTQAKAQKQARTPWNTKTEKELQSKTAEYFDLFNQAPTDIIAANPGFEERWLAADPSVRQHIAYRLKYDLGAAEEFAKQAEKRATLETANTTPILKREHHASDYFGDYDRAMEYIRDNNLPFVPQGNFKTPGSINHALDALGLNPHHRASAEDIARITASERIAREPPAQSKTLGEAAEKAKVTRRDGYGRPIP